MKKIILSALAIVAMASCSKDNEAMMPNDGEVRICSSIATRTVGNTWEATDAIGLYMTTNGGEFGTLGENVKYTTATTNGNFTSDSPLYFPATGNVDLMAYYPYNAVVNISAYPVVNVTNQPEDQGSIDLMKAEASNVAKNSAAVNMTFKHKLARIKLNIKNGDGVTADALANLAVTLKGTDTEATYDLTKADDASPITLGGVVDDIEMLIAAGTDPYVRSAEAIVIPQELDGATLTFTTSDNKYISTLETKAFTIGNEYIYNVTINKTGVTISGSTIGEWGEGDENGDDITAEIKPTDIVLANDIYYINTGAGLKAFADLVNGVENTTATTEGGITFSTTPNNEIDGVLTSDIDLSNICGATLNNGSEVRWEPIGSDYETPYKGKFDGGNNEIKNIYVVRGSGVGLFGYIDNSTIENLGVSGYVNGTNMTGAIVGSIETKSGPVTINNCYNAAEIIGNRVTGGVVGQVDFRANNVTLSNCQNRGSVTSNNLRLGGVLGGTYNTSYYAVTGTPKLTIESCYNATEGVVTHTPNYPNSLICGGVVGDINCRTDQTFSINSCYNKGNVNGDGKVGGVIGTTSGECETSEITNCYNEGKVSNLQQSCGGVVGYTPAQMINCYNTSDITYCVDDLTIMLEIGGVAGHASKVMKDCYNKGAISVTVNNNTTTYIRIGGVSAYVPYKMSGCYNDATGTITVSVPSYTTTGSSQLVIGGVAGQGQFSSGSCSITGCYNKADITSTANEAIVGGIFGYIEYSDLDITSCYNTGSIKYSGNVNSYRNRGIGGVIGYAEGESSSTNKSIYSCYSVGSISIKTDSTEEDLLDGVVAGYGKYTNFYNCYYNNETVDDGVDTTYPLSPSVAIGMNSPAGPGETINTEGLTTADMKGTNSTLLQNLNNSINDYNSANSTSLPLWVGVDGGYPKLSWE